jgi:hypothetical protein
MTPYACWVIRLDDTATGTSETDVATGGATCRCQPMRELCTS